MVFFRETSAHRPSGTLTEDKPEQHPLGVTTAVTVDMAYDDEAQAFVTYVKELHGMSSFGETQSSALDNTAEMIRGYIKSMEANGKRIPLAAGKLAELKHVVGIV